MIRFFECFPNDEENKTGLPDNLKSGIENLSGHSMDDVKVHYNSDKPAQLQAHAYAQGTDIHLGAGQEKHLAHEAWHVVQQKQGRVKPTMQMKGKVNVNDDSGLEREADVMGAKALQRKNRNNQIVQQKSFANNTNLPIQCLLKDDYPWNGVVIGTSLLATRSSPMIYEDKNKNTIADLPTKTRLKVEGNTSNWLKINVDTKQSGIVLNGASKKHMIGNNLKGYVDHNHIDEGVSNKFDEMLGDNAIWEPSGPTSGTNFQQWASAASETTAPNLVSSTVINCWEVVLLAAYKAKVIDWNWIHKLYTVTSPSRWVSKMSRGSSTIHEVDNPSSPLPSRGDLVFFDGLNHVALATGTGDSVYTFWPPPDKAAISGTLDEVKIRSIKSLSDYMESVPWPKPTVKFVTPSW